MTPPIKAGQTHSAVLVAVNYDHDDQGELVGVFGIEGTPVFTFNALIRTATGQDIPTTFKVGPHNIQELGRAVNLNALLTVAIEGRL